MQGADQLDVLVRGQYDSMQFRVVDPEKRSRFQARDLLILMQIVTRRKTYATPHSQGETEWQEVADKLNEAVTASFSPRACRDKVAALLRDHKRASAASRRASGIIENHTGLSDLLEGYLQLKNRFDEQQQEKKNEKNRKLKRLASAGDKAMRKAALRLKRRKNGSGRDEDSPSVPGSDADSDTTQAQDANGAVDREERIQVRRFLGADYSSDEEQKQVHSDEEDDLDESEEDVAVNENGNDNRGRTRLRVSEIWAKEEAMMEKERAAQAARNNALKGIIATLVNQNKMIMDQLARGSFSITNQP